MRPSETVITTTCFHYTALHRIAPPFGVQNPPKGSSGSAARYCVYIESQRVEPEAADPPSSSKQPCLTAWAYYRNSSGQRWDASNGCRWCVVRCGAEAVRARWPSLAEMYCGMLAAQQSAYQRQAGWRRCDDRLPTRRHVSVFKGRYGIRAHCTYLLGAGPGASPHTRSLIGTTRPWEGKKREARPTTAPDMRSEEQGAGNHCSLARRGRLIPVFRSPQVQVGGMEVPAPGTVIFGGAASY